jgi:hypothetical protein
MTKLEFETYIYNWASAQVAPILVKFASEDGPKPNDPFFDIDILNTTRTGQASRNLITDITITEPDGIQKVRWDEDITVNIQAFGKEACAAMPTLLASLEKESVIQALSENGIVVRDYGDTQSLAEIIDEVSEVRETTDIIFGIAQSIEDVPGWIETVDWEKEILPPI